MEPAFAGGCEDKSEFEFRSCEREVESSRGDESSSPLHKKESNIVRREASDCDEKSDSDDKELEPSIKAITFARVPRLPRLPRSVASNQHSGESYSVSGNQSLTYAVSSDGVSEVNSQPNNQGSGNHELDNQESDNQASVHAKKRNIVWQESSDSGEDYTHRPTNVVKIPKRIRGDESSFDEKPSGSSLPSLPPTTGVTLPSLDDKELGELSLELSLSPSSSSIYMRCSSMEDDDSNSPSSPRSVASSSSRYSSESYSVTVNRGAQSQTYAVNSDGVSEVNSQPNNQESGNEGSGNQELDDQGLDNEASGGQGRKT